MHGLDADLANLGSAEMKDEEGEEEVCLENKQKEEVKQPEMGKVEEKSSIL